MQAHIKGRRSHNDQAITALPVDLAKIPFTVADISRNSSALLAITILPDLQEALAVLRTAALLARSFNSRLCIEIAGMESLILNTPDDLGHKSFRRLCGQIQGNLRKLTSNGLVLVLEAGLTAASFTRADTISVRIRAETGEPKQRM